MGGISLIKGTRIYHFLRRSFILRQCRWRIKLLPYRLKEKKSIRRGSGVECPCCRFHFDDFVEFAYQKYPERFNPSRYQGIDQKLICPICHSLPRHRILVTWMHEHIDEIRYRHVLHFAQEHSLRMWMDMNRISYQTADLYADADLNLDLEDTGITSDSEQMIICNHVLEHVNDYRKARRELYRILAPNGMIIISFPIDPKLDMEVLEDSTAVTKEEKLQKFGQDDHLRVFGTRAKEILEGMGFLVEEINGSKMRPEIKPVVGPADYDSHILFILRKQKQ